MHHSLWAATIEERLYSKLRRDAGGCLIWTGAVSMRGYGEIRHMNRKMKVRRMVWELERGPLEPGQQLWRTCDGPRSCCDPDHHCLKSDAAASAAA